MNILWVTSEAVPFAKTGGLADVSGALPEALAARGHKVTVFMPYYPQQMGKLNLQFDRTYDMFGVPLFGSTQWCGLHVYRKSENLSFYFLEYNKFYDRPRLYDWVGQEYGDNAERFILLSRAAMEAAIHFRLDPDIIHANDWHSALCCVYLRSAIYSGIHNFRNTKSVLTIHNIGYQGIFPKDKLYATGLGWEYFNYTCLEFHDRLNFLKAGIMTADMVNTVSPTYAKEILSPEFSFSMDPALQYRNNQGRLRGIINGIDTNEWDPQNDPLLPANFSPGKLDGKKSVKKPSRNSSDSPSGTMSPCSPPSPGSPGRKVWMSLRPPWIPCCSRMISNLSCSVPAIRHWKTDTIGFRNIIRRNSHFLLDTRLTTLPILWKQAQTSLSCRHATNLAA